MRSVALALSLGVLVAGCGSPKPKSSPSAAKPPPVAATNSPEQKPVSQVFSPGRVVTVNGNLGYAILRFPIGTVPFSGQRLYAYRSGSKVGELKINGPHGDENAVADITEGEVKIGDEVRSKY